MWMDVSAKCCFAHMHELLPLQAVKEEVVQDDSFLEKFGKLRQLTEGVTVVLLDRYAPTWQAGSTCQLTS